MAENNKSGYAYYVNQGQKIAAQISRAGTAPLLSKMYTSTSLTATNFYNGATFGQDIGSEIPIIYGEILLSGYTLDSGTLRSDLDPDQLLKVYRFMTGEGPVKGVKGVGEDKLQNVIIGCEETVDATTAKANKPDIGFGEVLGIGGGLALMAAPTIAKLFKKDPLTGKDIPRTSEESQAQAAANFVNQTVDVSTIGLDDASVLTVDPTTKKVVAKKLTDMMKASLELVNHCCVGDDGEAEAGTPAGGSTTANAGDCNISFSVTNADMPPPMVQRDEQKLLPHSGSAKVYSEAVQLNQPGKFTFHLFASELALKNKTTATPQGGTSNNDGSITLESGYTARAIEQQEIREGTVKIAWCLVVDGEIVAKGRHTWSGYSAYNVSSHFDYSWAPAADNCSGGGANGGHSSKNGELRIYREDNFTSSSDVYFQGFSFVAATPVAAPPKAPQMPPVKATPATQIDDDGVFPAKVPSGGTYKTELCFPVGSDEDNGDCEPCAELLIKDIGTGAVNTPTDPNQPIPTDGKPTIDCDTPRDRQYDGKKLVALDLPKWSVTTAIVSDKTVTFKAVMTGGNGTIGGTVASGVTAAWDAPNKTFTATGLVDAVNTTIKTLKYTPGSTETTKITYSCSVKDSKNQEVGAPANYIHNKDQASPGVSATLVVAVGGTSGTLKVFVKGKPISDEIPATGTNAQIAAALASNINSIATSPDFTATVSGESVTLKAPSQLGDDANGLEITHTTSGNRTLNGIAAGSVVGKLAGGVDGTKDKVSLGSKLGKFALDILPAVGGGLIANTLMNTIGNIKVEIPADEEDANISVLMQGLMINVPSNYNADTRTYTGAWDYSTFKQAYTTNPAWCLLDFIESKRYGCGNSVRLDAAQKTQLYKDCYAAALRSDESVNNLAGGVEPRYTINTAIAGMSRLEVLDALAGVMHAQVVFTSNGMRVVQDRPQEAMGIVCNANVISGEFTYSGGSLDATYNIVDVAYNNPDKYFVEESLYVQDTSDLIARGFELRNSVTAFGTTSTGQATRYGAWVIQTEKTNPSIVNYTAGYDHEKYIPGDIVCVVNNFDEEILGTKTYAGRIKSISGNTVQLDRNIDQNNGTFYIMKSDGTMVASSGVGFQNFSTITVTDATGLKVGAVWAQFADIKKNYFKIVSISENNDGTFSVSAIKHDADKYSAIDGFAIAQ